MPNLVCAGDWVRMGEYEHGAKGLCQERAYVSGIQAANALARNGALGVQHTRVRPVIPVRDDIMPPILYVIRRGVKEAMVAEADCLIIDMETNGGRVDITEEIFGIIDKFKGETVTYVNRDAYSAGAFIAVSTDQIYMAPQSVIGAAAPIMMGPGGGASELPSTMEAKMNSAIRAKIRTQAEKNGYAIDVIEAMVDKSKTLERDGKTICAEGEILMRISPSAQMVLPSRSSVLDLSTIASMTSMAYPFFSACVRILARMAEFILASIVEGSSDAPPPGPIMIGAAAPITLCGAM